jgi:hypothetical protein
MAVQKAMAAGRISVTKLPAGGYSVDFAAADAQWVVNTHPSQGKDPAKPTHRQSTPAPASQPTSQTSATAQRAEDAKSDAANIRIASQFNVGRAAKMGYEAANAELDYRARRGELVERSEEEARARSLAQEVKDAILGIPDRIAPLLAAESDPLRVHIMLTDELIIALERLSLAGEAK